MRSLKKSVESDLIPIELSDLTVRMNISQPRNKKETENDCNLLKPCKPSSENDLTLFESNTQTHCWKGNGM